MCIGIMGNEKGIIFVECNDPPLQIIVMALELKEVFLCNLQFILLVFHVC
jgi:hypothetical protein